MIFKRKKNTAAGHEPKTKSDIFETAPDNKNSNKVGKKPVKQVSKTPSSALADSLEPPTRDAIFNDAPVIAQKEPPTGWLAVIAGPKKGHIINLGGEETLLDIDTDKSSLKISYNSALTQFKLRRDGEDKVLNPRDEFKIGPHTLLFIPLCGDGFDWQTS